MGKYILAKSAGFCFGVQRSITLAEKMLESGEGYCYGEIIHNRSVQLRLGETGLHTAESLQDIPLDSKVLIRAHGISSEEEAALSEHCREVTDATCPFVKKIHNIVSDASNAGRQVVVIGDEAHPEVRGICGRCEGALVFADADSFARKAHDDSEFCCLPLSIVFQTTQLRQNYISIEKIVKKCFTNAEIFDTICRATAERQEEAIRLSRMCDCMVVIGESHSANSCHLAELCKDNCSSVLFIPGSQELVCSQLKDKHLVGITAGASVPAWIIKEVVNKMSDEIKVEEVTAEEVAATAAEEAAPAVEEAAPAVEEAAVPAVEKSFDEMLEDSIRTIYNGETVSGYVVAITPTEVSVDLGTKHSAYIDVQEFTNNGELNVNDVIHVGDKIDACVVRVNDVEGTVLLSKKRLDNIKSWSDVEEAESAGSVVEGKVTEENKGGVVVNVKGIRVFVPASQTGLPRDAEMKELLGKTVQLKITEVIRARKRVVGSIKAVAGRLRKEAAEKIWNEIEIGKHYEGTVKSMTSYGAFVDIGGIDGMVHVSEISWGRVNKPEEVLSVGDKIDVYVINFDKEAKRISLGHKNPDENPWKKFIETYAVGDVANVKVVKLMPFGAFAEVVPGVDGLIHISQIANRRIATPGEILHVGDEVEAKITNVDEEKQKISLSIRALSEPEPAPAEQVEEETAEAASEVPAEAVETVEAAE